MSHATDGAIFAALARPEPSRPGARCLREIVHYQGIAVTRQTAIELAAAREGCWEAIGSAITLAAQAAADDFVVGTTLAYETLAEMDSRRTAAMPSPSSLRQ